MSAHTPMDRAEFDRAVAKVFDAVNSGRVSRSDARVELDALIGAYRAKKDELRFSSFIRANRLEHVFGMEG